MNIIRMEYPFLDEIVKYAKEHLPEEACGLSPEKKMRMDALSKKYII